MTTARPREPRAPAKPRAVRVAEAIAAELRAAGRPLTLAELFRARAIAADAREVYVVAERLRERGVLRRTGKGYQQGERHRYELAERRS